MTFSIPIGFFRHSQRTSESFPQVCTIFLVHFSVRNDFVFGVIGIMLMSHDTKRGGFIQVCLYCSCAPALSNLFQAYSGHVALKDRGHMPYMGIP